MTLGYASPMDANTPRPRWEDDRNKAEEILQLIAQLKRKSRELILLALVGGLLVGFIAGASYWAKYGAKTAFYPKEVPADGGLD